MADPTWDETSDVQAGGSTAPQQQQAPQASSVSSPTWDNTVDLEQKYGGLGQQALTAVEGGAEGVLGAAAPALEIATGLTTPQDIRGRAITNPVTHGVSEAGTFIGSTLVPGLGEASLAGQVGNIGEHVAAALPEATSAISKIASTGIKTGAEMAALQSSDELSKAITQDPNQSLQTAAVNIGLSGLIGGAGGAALGSVGPLWSSLAEKTGLPKIIDDAKAQYDFRQSVTNGDVPSAITNEVGTRLQEVDNIDRSFGSLKGAAIEPALPEVTPENTAKIDSQLNDISSKVSNAIDKASDNAYLKGGVPKLQQDLQDFLQVATDPQASYADKFDAINDLKRALQSKAKYALNAEDTALGKLSKGLAADIRPMLEDSKVWGDAGDVQRKANAAYSSFADAQKDAIGKFAAKSNVEGGYVADPTKINTLINQSLSGKAGLKTDFVKNYLDSTQSLADTLNKVYTDAGLEAPVRLTPTPALNHTLGRSSPGTTLGNWLYDKGAASVAGHLGGETIGAGLGSLVGHPAIGAIAGERLLAPALTSIAKPLLESATRSDALKGSLDYVINVIKGKKLLSGAIGNFFKAGAEVVPTQLIPSVASRDQLEKSLDYANSPENAMKIGGNLGHYLPEHATAAASTAAIAQNYFKSIKPKPLPSVGLDEPSKPSVAAENDYKRQLDIAQQPLLVLQHAKNGTLLPQDVQTLNTVFPALHAQMVSGLGNEMIKAKSEGIEVPYKTRLGLSKLMQMPIDGTMTPQASLAIFQSAGGAQSQQQQQGKRSQKRPTSAAIGQIDKVNSLYQTPLQARQFQKRD